MSAPQFIKTPDQWYLNLAAVRSLYADGKQVNAEYTGDSKQECLGTYSTPAGADAALDALMQAIAADPNAPGYEMRGETE